MAGVVTTPDPCPATKEVPVTDSTGHPLPTVADDGRIVLVQCSRERGHAGDHQGAPSDGQPVTWTD
jgi:hypothetical protein